MNQPVQTVPGRQACGGVQQSLVARVCGQILDASQQGLQTACV